MKVDYYRYVQDRGDCITLSEDVDGTISEVRRHAADALRRMKRDAAVHAVVSSVKNGSEVREGIMSRIYGDLLWLDRRNNYHSQYSDGSIGPVRKIVWD